MDVAQEDRGNAGRGDRPGALQQDGLPHAAQQSADIDYARKPDEQVPAASVKEISQQQVQGSVPVDADPDDPVSP